MKGVDGVNGPTASRSYDQRSHYSAPSIKSMRSAVVDVVAKVNAPNYGILQPSSQHMSQQKASSDSREFSQWANIPLKRQPVSATAVIPQYCEHISSWDAMSTSQKQ